jgi:hypothetical protein
MKVTGKWSKVGGLALHVLVGGMMIFAGSIKVLGFFPPEALAKHGLSGQILLIGAGELITAILLLVPRTSSLGVLLASSFGEAPSASTWLTPSPTSCRRPCSS